MGVRLDVPFYIFIPIRQSFRYRESSFGNAYVLLNAAGPGCCHQCICQQAQRAP